MSIDISFIARGTALNIRVGPAAFRTNVDLELYSFCGVFVPHDPMEGQ